MLRFFYFCFSYLFTPRWRLSKKSPPLAQACSLCPIQNSLTRLTSPTSLTCPQNLPVRLALSPASASLQLVPNPKFSHPSHKSHKSHLSPKSACAARTHPLAQACSLCPIQNSKFKILFTAHCPPPFWGGETWVRTFSYLFT